MGTESPYYGTVAVTVIGEKTKLVLAQRYREIKMEDTPDHVDAVNLAKIGELAYEKFMSKPTIIAVSCLQDGDEQRQREDYAAACCAMQNVQLAAWDAGVGMQWSTGRITMEEQTYKLLGIDSSQEYIIGFSIPAIPQRLRSQIGNQQVSLSAGLLRPITDTLLSHFAKRTLP